MSLSLHTSIHVQKRYLYDLKEATSEGECWNSLILKKVRIGLVVIYIYRFFHSLSIDFELDIHISIIVYDRQDLHKCSFPLILLDFVFQMGFLFNICARNLLRIINEFCTLQFLNEKISHFIKVSTNKYAQNVISFNKEKQCRYSLHIIICRSNTCVLKFNHTCMTNVITLHKNLYSVYNIL